MSRNSCGMRFWTNVQGELFSSLIKITNPIRSLILTNYFRTTLYTWEEQAYPSDSKNEKYRTIKRDLERTLILMCEMKLRPSDHPGRISLRFDDSLRGAKRLTVRIDRRRRATREISNRIRDTLSREIDFIRIRMCVGSGGGRSGGQWRAGGAPEVY